MPWVAAVRGQGPESQAGLARALGGRQHHRLGGVRAALLPRAPLRILSLCTIGAAAAAAECTHEALPPSSRTVTLLTTRRRRATATASVLHVAAAAAAAAHAR